MNGESEVEEIEEIGKIMDQRPGYFFETLSSRLNEVNGESEIEEIEEIEEIMTERSRRVESDRVQSEETAKAGVQMVKLKRFFILESCHSIE